MLNAQYMEDLRNEFDKGKDIETEFHARGCQKMTNDGLKGLDKETQKLLMI
jgi:hypothetical protein